MKTLKFKDFKTYLILKGEKTATLRLFDDKNLRVGDELDLVNSDSGNSFAHAVITEIVEKPIKEINNTDLAGHEKWNSQEEMMETHRRYYGDRVTINTPAKIIRFKLM